MGKKVLIVAGIVLLVIITMLMLTSFMPIIRTNVQVAADDPVLSGPAGGNFTYYESAVNWSPILIYMIPLVIGTIAVVIVLRRPTV